MTEEFFRQNENESYGSSEGMTQEPYNRLLDPNFISGLMKSKTEETKPIVDDLRPSENPQPVGKVEPFVPEVAPTPVEGPQGLHPMPAPQPIGMENNAAPAVSSAPIRPMMMPAPMMPNMGPAPIMPQAPSQIAQDAPVATPLPTTSREVEMAAFEEKAMRMEERAAMAEEAAKALEKESTDEKESIERTPAELLPQVFAPARRPGALAPATSPFKPLASTSMKEQIASSAPAATSPLSPETMQAASEKKSQPVDKKAVKAALKEQKKKEKEEALALKAWQKEQDKLAKQNGTREASDDRAFTKKSAVAFAICFALIGGLLGAGGSVVYTHLQMKKVQKKAVAAAKQEVEKVTETKSTSDKSTSKDKDPDDDTTSIDKGSHEPKVVESNIVDTSTLHTAAEVYAANVNATVSIIVGGTSSKGYADRSSSGSGFIITDDGYIVTNYHVVEYAGKSTITVITYNGEEFEAEIVGYDDPMDIAVLKIDAMGLESVIIGDSDRVNVGDDVMTIGNPLGDYEFTITKGVLSAKDRYIEVEGRDMTLFQMDCAVNGGNSGGPLFNMYGEVFAIVNAKHAGIDFTDTVDGISFAIPMNDVIDSITDIISKGYISSCYIGVECMTVDTKLNQEGYPDGVYLVTILDDGTAKDAGLKEKDVITKINGEKIYTTNDLKDFIEEAGPDGELELTIVRDGSEKTITVKVVERQVPALG